VPAAKFWPRESRNLIGPNNRELSREVNCLRDSLTISIRPPPPRNRSAEVMCRSKIRRIVIISFSSENGVRFDVSCLSLGAEKSSNSKVFIPFYRLVSRNFIFKLSVSIENNRVVVVSAFYETKRPAEGLVSFAQNDQQVNR